MGEERKGKDGAEDPNHCCPGPDANLHHFINITAQAIHIDSKLICESGKQVVGGLPKKKLPTTGPSGNQSSSARACSIADFPAPTRLMMKPENLTFRIQIFDPMGKNLRDPRTSSRRVYIGRLISLVMRWHLLQSFSIRIESHVPKVSES